jgi:DNA-binding beta-propeller fold protein YncE
MMRWRRTFVASAPRTHLFAAFGGGLRRNPVVIVPAPRPRAAVLFLTALLLALLPAAHAWARPGPAGPSTPGAAARAGTPSAAAAHARTAHEVWALDQGTDLIHIHDSRAGLAEVATIDLSANALRNAGFTLGANVTNVVPHMIEFDSQHRYAFVAATAGAVTIVIDARTKQVAEVLPTGPASHMAGVTPDDSAVWVAVIGSADPTTQALVEIPLDLDAPDPTFAIGRRVVVHDALQDYLDDESLDWTFPGFQPVCQQFTPDSKEAWVTLGPQWNRGGLFVLDLDTATVTAAWDPTEVKANCGVGVDAEGTRVVANWSGAVIGPGQDSDGEWYLFDARSKELLRTESARGVDAHGVRFTPDGKRLWAVNRVSDNGLVIDARTFRVLHEIERVGDAPDILDFSPDGSLVYVTQRGPAPRSGGVHAASGQQPGVAVIHAASRRTLAVIEPPRVDSADGLQLNDLHGVGVRPVGGDGPVRGRSAHALVRRPPVAPVSVRSADLSFGCHVAG